MCSGAVRLFAPWNPNLFVTLPSSVWCQTQINDLKIWSMQNFLLEIMILSGIRCTNCLKENGPSEKSKSSILKTSSRKYFLFFMMLYILDHCVNIHLKHYYFLTIYLSYMDTFLFEWVRCQSSENKIDLLNGLMTF